MIVLLAAVLYFYVERGGNQYGPRFHYEAFLFMVVFVAGNLLLGPRLNDRPRRDRVLFGLLAASVAAMPVSFAVHAVIEQRVIRERMDPYAAVAASRLARAIVLIEGRVGTRRSMAGYDLTRNGIDAAGRPVLYGLHLDDASSCAAAAGFPDRPPYVYRWEPDQRSGELSPLECRSSPAHAHGGVE
jgi:peptidoglycan/LPS O-acetylase OafA/YrhL